MPSQEHGPLAPGAMSALLRQLAAPPTTSHRQDSAYRPGQIVGRFELLHEIGRGGFGVVFEARDRDLGRNVALKAVKATGDPHVRTERLLQEAEAAARLCHPNIVTLHDVGRSEVGPYLILELLRGETLARRLRRGPLPVAEALRIATDVANGLAHAHAHDVVHRDLTPGNVFLCADGQVKVLDFGMARAFGRRKVEGGTRRHMAPEQVSGAPEDERTDVFAMGVVLYEMLTGELPFTEDELRDAEARAPRVDIAEQPGVGDLLARLLEKNPVNRPRDAGEALAALRLLERDARSAEAPVVAARPRVRRRTMPRRRVVLWTLVIGGSAAALAGAWRYARGNPAPARQQPSPFAQPVASIAVLPFVDMSPQHDQEYFADGIAEEILSALAQVEQLRVPGRTSSFYFKGKAVKLAEIGRELHVSNVLEGSVRKEGARVRVTTQLVRVEDESHIWSETYDRDLRGVLALQEEIAGSVAAALRVKLSPVAGTGEPRAMDPKAYEEYLLGRHLFFTFLADQGRRVTEAKRHFERALELDPASAAAWAFLSIAITQLADIAGTATSEERQIALAAAEKAVALDPGDSIGYVARAYLRQTVLWDWTGASADVDRALALKRGHLRPYNQKALLLAKLGRAKEATAYARKATEIDPLNVVYLWNLVSTCIDADDLAGARAALARAVEISGKPDPSGAGFIELLAGSPQTALALYETISDEEDRLLSTAIALHVLGRRDEANRALSSFVERYGGKEPFAVATLHAWRGERDDAFEWAERAYQRRDLGIATIKMSRGFRRLHGDPRYSALLRKLNLPLN